MTAVSSDHALSRFYEAPERRFRFTRKTALAVSAALAFHGMVGYFVVKGHFEPLKTVDYGAGPIIETFRWEPDKPPPPPPPQKAEKVEQLPPEVKPQTLAVREPERTAFPTETYTAATTDAKPTDAMPVKIEPEVKPTPVAPSIPKPDPIIRNPTWLKKPTADQVSALFPQRALERGVTGGATLLCEVMETGAVNNCAVVEESPKGYRFGDAAIAMTRYFRMNPRTVDGAVVAGSKVRIPIVFNAG